MTYYSDIKFSNGLPVSSLFCYTALLLLHQCLCALLALSVLFPFILLVPCPFNSQFPFYALLLVRSTCFFTPQSPSITTTPKSLLFCILIVSMQLVHPFSPCLCMLLPCRVLCLIIIATLQLLWQFNPCVHHHWVLSRNSLASLEVETLCLLYHRRAHPLAETIIFF
jgi:hypothetical protein